MLNLTESGEYKCLIGYLEEENKTIVITKINEDLYVLTVSFDDTGKINTYNKTKHEIEIALKLFLDKNQLLHCDYLNFLKK